jgi:hypothetical protein
MHSEKEQRGRGTVDGNLHLCRRSTRSFASSGGGFASAARWRGLVSERECDKDHAGDPMSFVPIFHSESTRIKIFQ